MNSSRAFPIPTVPKKGVCIKGCQLSSVHSISAYLVCGFSAPAYLSMVGEKSPEYGWSSSNMINLLLITPEFLLYYHYVSVYGFRLTALGTGVIPMSYYNYLTIHLTTSTPQ